jgi:polyhydroxybutyrate depolymerase
VVYPDGWRVSTITSWNAGACCNPAASLGVDDLGFVSSLLDHLEAELCVDTSAVFAAGMSNGAMLTYRLACEMPDRFAAFAPVSGVLEQLPCTPTKPVPLLAVNGLADLNVPYHGGFGCGATENINFTSVPVSIDTMAAINNCSCRTHDESCTTSYLIEGHGSCASYGPCTPAAGAASGAYVDVVLCTIDGGGHAWPGARPNGAPQEGCNNTIVQDFNTNTHIWAFFNATRQASGGGTAPPAGGDMSSASSLVAWLHTMWW